MGKLPRKEDLLPKAEPQKPENTSNRVDTTVQKARDDAEIAAAQTKKVESEIKTRLLEKGYQTLEAALKDIEAKKLEVGKALTEAESIKQEILEEYEKNQAEKEKLGQLVNAIKIRETTINARLEQAMKLEQSMKAKTDSFTTSKQELQELIDYHQENILPCLKALKAVSKTIYEWLEILETTQYDFTQLYNYIGHVMKVIDRYVDRVPAKINGDGDEKP